MLKKIRNKKRTGNKVSARYKYVKNKADWIYENTLERFDFAVKRRFIDKQDTTHFVFSFSRILSNEEKKKARQLISDFFFNKFGTEYYLSIAEHNDNQKTHYHILLSRNIETGKMLHLKNAEYMQLVRELNDVMSELMNEHELEIKEKYGTSKEYQMQLEAWQYHDYEKAVRKFLNKDFDVSDTKSFKAIAKASAEFVFKMLEKKDLDTVREFEYATGIKFFVEKARKRERLYVDVLGKKVRVDKLDKQARDRLIDYYKSLSVIEQVRERKFVITDSREKAIEYLRLVGYEGEIEFIQLSDLYELKFFKQNEYNQLLETVKQALDKDYLIFVEDETVKLQFKNFVLKDLGIEEIMIRDSRDIEFVKDERSREKARERAKERERKIDRSRWRRRNDNDWGMWR